METEAQPRTAGAWWAEGDLPVRAGCRVEPCIDGHVAMLRMCRAFLAAKRYILLAGWDIQAELPLVRGEDAVPGPPASAAFRTLMTELRQEGLDDAAIALWTSKRLRVCDVLGFAVSRGVKVGVLLWDAFHYGSHITNDPKKQQQVLRDVGVDCVLDDSSRHITHLTESLHQKCCVVDGEVAFVGGIDLTVQENGDYDRWDTHRHPCVSTVRTVERRPATHPWHDVHTRLTGPVVADVQRNITQRWLDVAARHKTSAWPGELEPPAGDAATVSAGTATAQIVRTIPPDSYAFAPHGISTIKQAYLHAITQARRFIYLENQYLWPEVFLGLDKLKWGGKSPDLQEVLEAFAGALERGVHVAIVLPDHPNCGRVFTDDGVEILKERAAAAGHNDCFHAFILGNSDTVSDAPGGILYRPVYTHAKVAIVDDEWFTVGSANLNSRGMRTDAEINVSVLDPATARSLRFSLWTEHLQRPANAHEGIEDAIEGLQTIEALAESNRDRVRRRLPIQGHLLPYITEKAGHELALPVHQEHGWLDNLEGGAGGYELKHAGRYI
ncbi:MAG TPA: phospholipase D-like domain-containing protein [Ktedonobacterales bacterium]|nr:phospholipase D-like domain-containing protein [Ktedonobacterales bacterium]